MKFSKIYYLANAKIPTSKAHGIQLVKMCEAMLLAGADLELILPKRKITGESIKNYYGLKVDLPACRLPVFDLYDFGKAGYYFASFSFMISSLVYFLFKKLFGEKFIIYTVDMDRFSFSFLPFLGIPYFAEIHDAKPNYFRFRLFLKRAVGIIAINQIIKDEIAGAFGISPEKISVEPNGIDLAQFAVDLPKEGARRILNIPQDKFIALYSGRFYKWKGLETLVGAAKEAGGGIFFYLVGGTEDELREASGEKSIPSNMVCVGTRNYKEMPLWLRAVDVLIVLGTKKNDYSYMHTSPMKLFEYMVSKRPIIASATPANKEIISDEEAVFYEPDNASDLAKKLKWVFANRNNLSDMANRAYLKGRQFSWGKRAGTVLQFIGSRTE